MTVASSGPGAVGGALGVRLALAGERVICVAEAGDRGARSPRDGLTLVTDDGARATGAARGRGAAERARRPPARRRSKAHGSLTTALSRIGRAEPGVVLPLLNGLEHMDVLRAQLRERRGGDHRPLRGVSGVADADRPADSGRRERRRYRGSGAAGTRRHRHAGRRQREGCAVGEARPAGSDRRADVGGW